MRAFVILAAIAAAAAVAVSVAGASVASSHTALTITFWENGERTSDPDVWTLRCDPARGTHPRAAVACQRLEAGGWRLVSPVREGSICTQIYGGPQVARVVGQLEGRKIWARFTRVDGCQISRWNKLSPWLFPAGRVS